MMMRDIDVASIKQQFAGIMQNHLGSSFVA